MANHFSSLKRVRITERRTAVNKVRKSRMRNAIRLMRRALDKKDAETAGKLLPATFSMVDRAAKWGVIKVNTANRYKARLHARVKALQTSAA
ncbi:MAG: 30S ribosomal protein S20 [Bryobacteraceae bacterium]|jgi:small subunit ribosomal protein S20|nr:30S ribosomal protein S20 [Bryobacteraceae bacterium]